MVPSLPNALLAHEVRDDTVKCRALEVQRLSGLTHALLASAKAAKVLCSLWGHICAKFHDDSACSRTTNSHVEVDLWVRHDV